MLAATLAMTFVTGELVVRWLWEPDLPVRVVGDDFEMPESQYQGGFRSDPDLIWRLRPDVSFADEDQPFRGRISNLQSLRMDVDLAEEKEPNEVRLLFLGDSITFGWRTRIEETFASRTAELLSERFPGHSFTAINAGVPAYSLLQAWQLLETEGFDFLPDLIVLGSFGFNDSRSWNAVSDLDQLRHWQARYPPPALRWSALATFVANWLATAPEPQGSVGNRPRLLPSEFEALLEEIAAAAQARGIGLVVVIPAHQDNVNGVFPAGGGPYQKRLRNAGQHLHLEPHPEPALVDGIALLEDLLDEHVYEDLMFDYVHPSPRFHAALADELFAVIEPWVDSRIRFGLLH